MVVAQLAEQPLLTSEIRGSNPNNGKVYHLCISDNCNSEKTKIKKKRPGLASLKNDLWRVVPDIWPKSLDLLKCTNVSTRQLAKGWLIP